jgi:hypothetical protein
MKRTHSSRWFAVGSLALAAVCSAAFMSSSLLAQSSSSGSSPPHAQHDPPTTQAADASLAERVAELQAQVARLQAALDQMHRAGAPSQQAPAAMPGMGSGTGGSAGMPSGGSGMSGGGGGGMGMMDDMMMNRMGGMSGGSGGGMPGGGMGMDMMMGGMSGGGAAGMGGGGMAGKEMSGMMGMAPAPQAMRMSSLPGFPGATHLYHVGATGFFLDHAGHLSLTTEQRASLGQVRERAMLEQATARRSIEQAEQELWSLTAADQPDAQAIEAKVAEIERLRGQQRLQFIRAVGEAGQVLTDEQRRVLTGQSAPANPAMPAGGGMGDM